MTGALLPATCGVVGGGRMGAGIAHALLLAGAHVVVVERSEDEAGAARSRVERAVARSVERGTIGSDGVAANATYAVGHADLADAGLVIEAVPEDLDLKISTLRSVEDVVAADAVIATNTSSISVERLASELKRPERVLGMHFFNPVPASKLVEIVVAPSTDSAVADRAPDWVETIGKTPVVVRDAPGFASSRLGLALGLEAIRMVQDGIASAADIDAAMTLGYGHPVGPLRLTDMVGLDVRLGIARYLAGELGERFAPPGLLEEMVERGDLGRKSGRGFYEWDE